MEHMDMDGLEGMTDRPQGVDYSDFEHEVIGVSQQQNSGAGSSGIVKFTQDPLAVQGGLRPNQVAELVWCRINAGMVKEDGAAEVNGTEEFRGVVGFDLDEQDDPTPGNSRGNPEGETEIIQDSGNFGTVNVYSVNEPGIVSPFRAIGANHEIIEKQYRADWYTGRGPVVDPDDEVTIIGTTANLGDGLDAAVQFHALWDVYEIDDARSEFALPE